MRKLLVASTAMLGLLAAALPALAGYDRVNCHDLPRAEWVKCVWDTNSDQTSQ